MMNRKAFCLWALWLCRSTTSTQAFATKSVSVSWQRSVSIRSATHGVGQTRWVDERRSSAANRICFGEPSSLVRVYNTGKPKTSSLFVHNKKQDPDTVFQKKTAKWKVFLASWRAQVRSLLKWGRRKAAIALFCMMMVFSLLTGDAVAKGTMGRSGGSFKSAPRAPSSSRVYSPPSRSYHRPPSTQLYYRNPVPRSPIVVVGSHHRPYGPQIRRGFRASDMILVAGSGLAIAYGVSTKLEKERTQNSSSLGPGFSVAKLTVSMNVPNRDSPTSILHKLQQLSSRAQTNTRKGVQDLVSSVALELLRQEKSIRSAATFSEQYKNEGETERSYFRQSIQERSKFDDEREYTYGSGERTPQIRQKEEDTTATEAVVTILIAIEGDSTKLPKITSRDDVVNALNRLAVDAQMDDCLLSGEVSWAPDLRSESLSLEDIYVDYPMLFPV